ncbi:TPA: anti-phage dCTP deaminase [Mannheimia haemolytica]
MLTGKITRIDAEKKYAKLESDNGKEYTFLKNNLLDYNAWDKISVGMKVSFELEISKKQKEYASNVNLLLDSEKTNHSKSVTEQHNYLLPESKVDDSELIIGIVSSVGTPSHRIITPLKDRLEGFGYSVTEIRVSQFLPPPAQGVREDERIFHFMTEGDSFREKSNNNSILAIASTVKIKELRDINRADKNAYIINSLKHPDEVELLRKVYGDGFYLFGIHSDKPSRKEYLEKDKHCEPYKADELIKIDENEDKKHGQKTRDTYHLSDFFLNLSDNEKQVKNTIQRFLELIFSDPYKTPTFDEYAMFMAFNSSVRSADLSRQVGAVISRNNQILSTGANDVPKFGGGLYWAEKDKNGEVKDKDLGRDYKRSIDQNKQSQKNIIENILNNVKEKNILEADKLEQLKLILKESEISDLTEFGRVVHAEMEAILSCSREGISTKEAILYCTTFPCHNCAKHIIASGITRVVYVEPYPKSKALDFHNDSIELQTNLDDKKSTDKVIFEPFIGVGPRRFLDLFSMSLGSGTKLRRKDKEGAILDRENNKNIRTPLLKKSYIELENDAQKIWENFHK